MRSPARTRATARRCLRQLGIDGKALVAVHQHNEREGAAAVLLRLSRGERVAYVSDAGTPAISDPGAALVDAAQSAGYRVLPIPGASSAAAAVSVAGDAISGPFTFVGFLPTRGGERAQALAALAATPHAQVLFEAPHRIDALASSLADACGERMLTVCRELTKQFETVANMPAQAWPAWLAADANRSRGEFVVVVHAEAATTTDGERPAFDTTLSTLLAALPLKQAVALTSELTGAPRNAVYERALALKNASQS